MGVCFFCITVDRGELHRVAVVGQNATLLQEVPLFTSLEPVNNIMLHQVGRHHFPLFSLAIQCYVVPRNIQPLSAGSGSGWQPSVAGSSPS